MSMENEQWFIRKLTNYQKNKIKELKASNQLALDEFTLKYLVLNGHDTVQKIKNLMYFQEKDLPDIKLAKDAKVFLNRIMKAILQNENIVIWGDYDSDGINATTIIKRALLGLGVKVNYFIPHRFNEGYGMSVKGMKRLLKEYPDTDLIITVDNGIVAFEGVDYANKKGIEVLITDHHEPKEDGTLPNALAVVDLKRKDETYPFIELCGAGLIFRLMQELYVCAGYKKESLNYLYAYVAVATVGDVVPLLEENRFFVKKGIEEIKKERLKCFEILNRLCSVKSIDEETLGFLYVPILNAIGRVNGSVYEAVDFLLEENEDKSIKLANYLINLNKERKEICSKEEQLVNRILKKDTSSNDVIVIYNDSFNEGTVGITAGRIKEKYNKPTFVFTSSEEEGIYKGSARSIPGFNMKSALDKCSHLLEKYGGHELAAGVSIKAKNIEKFQKAMNDLANDPSFCTMETSNKFYIDFAISEDDISFHMINTLNNELRPFGQCFPKPIIGLKDFHYNKSIGLPTNVPETSKKHLKLVGDKLDVIWFNGYQEWLHNENPIRIKCIGVPNINTFNGRTKFQFQVENNRFRII